MNNSSLPRAIAVVERGLAERLHIGAQVYVSLHGRTVADLAIGLARHDVPMATDTLMPWLSSAKPVAAVAIAQLWERNKLNLDDCVADHIPEFGNNGKETITIRHLLTHTGGFRGLAGDTALMPWDQILARIYAARLEPEWVPGCKAGYHPASSWFILGELVHRLDGRPFEQYVREEIFLPLGMKDSWIGMSPAQYRAYGKRIGFLHDMPEQGPETAIPADTEQAASACRPGSSGHGPIRELGRFYEMLLSRGHAHAIHDTRSFNRKSADNVTSMSEVSLPSSPSEIQNISLSKFMPSRGGSFSHTISQLPDEGNSSSARRSILRPQTIEAMIARHRVGLFDHTFKHIIDWGLGFILNSRQYGVDTVPYGYGPHASPRTFGHGGRQSSVGFADPEHGLVVAAVFNGTPGEARHDRRLRAFTAAVYEDLELSKRC